MIVFMNVVSFHFLSVLWSEGLLGNRKSHYVNFFLGKYQPCLIHLVKNLKHFKDHGLHLIMPQMVLQTELISGDQNGNIRVWDLTANSCSCELVRLCSGFFYLNLLLYKLFNGSILTELKNLLRFVLMYL